MSQLGERQRQSGLGFRQGRLGGYDPRAVVRPIRPSLNDKGRDQSRRINRGLASCAVGCAVRSVKTELSYCSPCESTLIHSGAVQNRSQQPLPFERGPIPKKPTLPL